MNPLLSIVKVDIRWGLFHTKRMRRVIKIDAGGKFGLWTVVRRADHTGKPGQWFVCKCICGRRSVVSATALHKGRTRGCRKCRSGLKKHGLSGTKEHRAWKSLLCRGRATTGIYKDVRVCDRWLPENNGFSNFLADIGPAPTAAHSIDRVDNNRGYSPDNCRWATSQEQSLNTRQNHIICVNGEKAPVAVFARRFGVNPDTVYTRLKRGWPTMEALGLAPHKVNRTQQRGEKCYAAHLRLSQVRDIRRLIRCGGLTRQEASKLYRVSYWSICDIMQGKSWAWDDLGEDAPVSTTARQ